MQIISGDSSLPLLVSSNRLEHLQLQRLREQTLLLRRLHDTQERILLLVVLEYLFVRVSTGLPVH